MANRWKTMETVTDFILEVSKIIAGYDFIHESKRHLLLGRKVMTNVRQHIKRWIYYFANKGPSSQSYGFSSSHVWMWELDYKKAEHCRIDALDLCCWRRLLRVPWTAGRSSQSILKEITPEYTLEGLMLRLKLQYSGHLMQRTDSFEETLMLGKIEGERRRAREAWYGWMASPTQWTWVRVNSRIWWCIGRPGMLQSLRLRRVGLTEKLNWTDSLRALLQGAWTSKCYSRSLVVLIEILLRRSWLWEVFVLVTWSLHVGSSSFRTPTPLPAIFLPFQPDFDILI